MAAPQKKKPLLKRIRDKLKLRLKKIIKFINYKWVLPVVYKWYARRPIDEKLVVFADARDRDMPDNFRGLYLKCKEDGYSCEFLSGRQYSMTLPHWRWEKWKCQLQFIRLFACCRVLFLVDYYDLADIVRKREGTDVVQLWHGCGLLKKWGYAATSLGWGTSEKERRKYPLYVNQTLSVISSRSAIVREGYREAFRCDPNIIQPLGVPRTDIYDIRAKTLF